MKSIRNELPQRHRVREVGFATADRGDLLHELDQAAVARQHEAKPDLQWNAKRPCGRSSGVHVATHSEAMNPEARSRGSPMPRGEQIAKPAEWETHVADFVFLVPSRKGSDHATRVPPRGGFDRRPLHWVSRRADPETHGSGGPVGAHHGRCHQRQRGLLFLTAAGARPERGREF